MSSSDPSDPPERQAPIFILGTLQRSGTNFVTQLLALHPDVATRPYIIEDFLLKHAEWLERYRDAVVGDWSTNWHVPPEEGTSLLRRLGDGVIDWLTEHADGKRVVTKTPNVRNLHLFPHLFPGAVLIVVVRDGRAVVESGVRSFDWNYRRSIIRWATSVDTIIDFEAAHPNVRYLRVRYEDLVGCPVEPLRELLEHCGLDPERYDFEAAANLPVLGSSETRASSSADVHWRPVPRPADFNPRSRFESWDAHRMATFNDLAGRQARALGYEIVPAKPNIRLRVDNNASDLVRAARRKWRVLRWGPINRRELVDPGERGSGSADNRRD